MGLLLYLPFFNIVSLIGLFCGCNYLAALNWVVS